MNRIKQLRKEKGYTQAELSKMLNIEQRTLRRWETEDVALKKDKVSKLMDIFCVSEAYLLGYSKIDDERDISLDLFSVGFEYNELLELDEQSLHNTLNKLNILQNISVTIDENNKIASIIEIMKVLEEINSSDSSMIFELAKELLAKNLLEKQATYYLIEKFYNQNKNKK